MVSPALTYGDLLRMDSAEGRHEIFDGRIYERPSPTLPHQRLVQRLARAFGDAVRDGSKVLSAPVDVVLAPDTVARPDLLVVLAPHLGILQDAVRGAPDLVMEVLEPATARIARRVKMDAYARFSVPEYWLADGDAKAIEIHRLDPHAQLYRLAETCRSGDWATTPRLPELAVEVGRLFG